VRRSLDVSPFEVDQVLASARARLAKLRPGTTEFDDANDLVALLESWREARVRDLGAMLGSYLSTATEHISSQMAYGPGFRKLDAIAGAIAESRHENSAAKHYSDHVWRMLHHSGGAIPKETSQLVSDVRSIAAGLGLAMAAMPNLSQSAMLAAQEGLTSFTKSLYRYASRPAEMVAGFVGQD
jgi:hypothetical protein